MTALSAKRLGWWLGFRDIAVPFPAVVRNWPVLRKVLHGSRPIQNVSEARSSVPRVPNGRCMKLNTWFHLLPRLSMSGVVPHLPRVFMACIETTLPFTRNTCSLLSNGSDYRMHVVTVPLTTKILRLRERSSRNMATIWWSPSKILYFVDRASRYNSC